MKHTEIQYFRQMLESQRDEAHYRLHRLSDETRSLDQDARDSGDQSIASTSKESLFQRSSLHLGQLRSIEAALARIDDGTFGVCASCDNDIATRRLQALPWTEHCLRCQELLEQQSSARQPREWDDTEWRRAG